MLTSASAAIGNATGGKFGFAEESAFAKMCPNLTFKQVKIYSNCILDL